VDPRFEQLTHEVEDHHWWYVGRRKIVRTVVAGLPLPRSPRILDAGCGSGRNMVELADFGRVTGIDKSAAAVDRAAERDAGLVTLGAIELMPFEEGTFDLAVALDVIEHIDDDRAAFRELLRVVRPGGMLLVSVPAYPRLWSAHDVLNEHRRRYTRRSLLAATRDAGWTCTHTTHFNSSLLLPAAAHRLALKRSTKADPRESELSRMPPALNRLLARPLAFEARLIGAGARLPAGLSLLATFRRPLSPLHPRAAVAPRVGAAPTAAHF
jgi:SAM-dependent methyltransferase